jgi:hypothetical protein
MTRGIWISVCVVGLSLATGCAGSTHQSRVEPTGLGTFMIPSSDLMGASSSSIDKAKAYDDAASYCTDRGKEIETVLTSENGSRGKDHPSPLLHGRSEGARTQIRRRAGLPRRAPTPSSAPNRSLWPFPGERLRLRWSPVCHKGIPNG